MAVPAQVEISISTSSEPMNLGNLPAPQPPTITLNGEPLTPPPYAATSPNGIQVVVLDATQDLTNPASIISNNYQQVYEESGGWYLSYRYMYENAANQLLASGNPQQQVVFVASYGLDVAMVPTPDVLEQLMLRGAGPQLQKWPLLSQPSEGGYYIQYPANYVMVGASAFGYGEATEQFDYTTDNVEPVTTSLTATLQNVIPPTG
jgi:hypothetical protein